MFGCGISSCVTNAKPPGRKRHFADNVSLYNGEKVSGYCLLCNKILEVRLRTWFLCDICYRVAGAIGRNHVAE